ncbi:hypothetical protein MTR_6g092850 [Medicago truncatula]|uniref:Uncharacterized protein n=1 Tax=Medicago truncatula TaxID=3880 RepID=A0A072UN39_MEDTR|nr:hypothetical protein MTR_6g092850 [Medicago truncatula]
MNATVKRTIIYLHRRNFTGDHSIGIRFRRAGVTIRSFFYFHSDLFKAIGGEKIEELEQLQHAVIHIFVFLGLPLLNVSVEDITTNYTFENFSFKAILEQWGTSM